MMQQGVRFARAFQWEVLNQHLDFSGLARLTTSVSSMMKPQYIDAAEHSCAGLKKLTGNAPPPSPTNVTWPNMREIWAAISSAYHVEH